MPSYPSSLPVATTAGANLATNPHSTLHDNMFGEVVAIATELGVTPKGTYATVKARLDAIEGAADGWALTAIGQPGPVAVTTNYGWKRLLLGGRFEAQITMTVTGVGGAGTAIDIATPYTLTNIEAIGGSFTYFDTGNTIFAGSVYPLSTSLFRLQVTGNGNQLGANPSIALAAGDIIRVTIHGRV